jgi:phosphopantothenate---cysteine ligase (CTP)
VRVLLTFGPGYEPLDEARRLTNLSTGRLGAELAAAFVAAGWTVHCLRGEGSTHPAPAGVATLETFGTNDDLAGRLRRLAGKCQPAAVLHAAALCDYRVVRALDAAGATVTGAKIPSRAGRLTLELEPATKVLPQLRGWFPRARLAGWKYELDGTRADALARGRRQLAEAGTDACVVNGRAHGPGFGLCRSDGSVTACADAAELAARLLAWLATPNPSPPPDRKEAAPHTTAPLAA